MEDREQLLRNLRKIKAQLQRIYAAMERQAEIVGQYREKQVGISTDGAKNKMKLVAAVCLGITLFIQSLVFGIGHGDWTTTIILVVCISIIVLLRDKKSKWKNLAYIVLVLIVGVLLYDLIRFREFLLLAFSLIVVIPVLFLSIRTVNKRVDIKNEEISHFNQDLQRQYDETVEEIDALREELWQMSGSWFPKDYYSIEAVNSFISDLENHRADSIKEAVLQLDNREYRKRMLASQQAILDIERKELINMQSMRQELRYANLLSLGQIALQGSILGAVQSNTNAVRSVANQQRITNHLLKRR
ncbi:MAG: hypothetical protein KBS74_05095 [Clostridiales bacterium]|nr:hypothetical protein [Candidatus Cacconaster stercorequi]